MTNRTLCIAAVVLCLVQTSHSQVTAPATLSHPTNSTGDPVADMFNQFNFDRAPSAAAAADALGLSPETVSNPSTPRELASDLINGVDHNGVLQHGLAIAAAPFRLLGLNTNLRDYRGTGEGDVNAMFRRWVYNFSVSVATSKATDNSDAVQLALGFKEVFYESADHDPYRNPELDKAFKEAAGQVNLPDDLDNPNTPLPTVSQSASKAWSDAVADFNKNKWQGAIWTGSIAPTWNSASGKLSDLSSTGFTAWTTAAYGTKNLIKTATDSINLQLIGEARYRQNELVIDTNDKTHTANQNSFILGGRLKLGTQTFNGFAEGGYVHVWHGLNGDGAAWRGALGVEKKITSNIWLVLSAGEQFGQVTAKTNDLFVMSSLRLGTADKAQFAPQ